MTIYQTSTETDAFYHLVTDEFHVLQQLRIQPRPCQCLLRTEGGPWRWVSQAQAARILADWERQSTRNVPPPGVESTQAA